PFAPERRQISPISPSSTASPTAPKIREFSTKKISLIVVYQAPKPEMTVRVGITVTGVSFPERYHTEDFHTKNTHSPVSHVPGRRIGHAGLPTPGDHLLGLLMAPLLAAVAPPAAQEPVAQDDDEDDHVDDGDVVHV